MIGKKNDKSIGRKRSCYSNILLFLWDCKIFCNLNLNFKIDENSIDFNIDTPNAKDYLGISFKQNNEIINENEIKYDQNIIFYFGNETNPYSIELINNATIYNNTDININNTQNYVEVEQLTEDDIITILTNLQNQIEGTVFQSLFELFIKSTY